MVMTKQDHHIKMQGFLNAVVHWYYGRLQMIIIEKAKDTIRGLVL